MITKWYPSRDDPQFGVFIQKHARAIALENRIAVLYIHSLNNLTKSFEIDELKNSGVNETIVYFRKNTSLFRGIINPVRYLFALQKGIKILNEKHPRPDIIHAYILLRTGIIAWYLSMIKKVPYVISEQWSGYVTGKYKSGNFIRKMICRIIVKHASAVTSVSGFLLKGMNDSGLKNNNYQIVPNAVEIKAPVAKTDYHKNIIYVLLVADLVDEIKNISGVISMINQLSLPLSFELHIIGKGKDEKYLKEKASEKGLLNKNIFFEGLRNNEEVYEYLQRCDFLVMNSRFETFSLICAEAMSCGKPVLATRCGGPNDFVIPETGRLIDVDNEEQLKNNFVYMLDHYADYDRDNIRSHVIGLFTQDKIGEKFNEVYSSIPFKDRNVNL